MGKQVQSLRRLKLPTLTLLILYCEIQNSGTLCRSGPQLETWIRTDMVGEHCWHPAFGLLKAGRLSLSGGETGFPFSTAVGEIGLWRGTRLFIPAFLSRRIQKGWSFLSRRIQKNGMKRTANLKPLRASGHTSWRFPWSWTPVAAPSVVGLSKNGFGCADHNPVLPAAAEWLR